MTTNRKRHTCAALALVSFTLVGLSATRGLGAEFSTSDLRANAPGVPLPPQSDSSLVGEIIQLGSDVLFACDGPDGLELWRSDGTVSGTEMIRDIHPGPAGSAPRCLARVGEWVLFIADDGVSGSELWRTDGTTEGTSLLLDIRPGPEGSNVSRMCVLGDLALFAADDGSSGVELWKSDGTASGTGLVRDILPGAGSSTTEHLTPWKDLIVFVADDGVHGRELWRTDGSTDGTMLIADTRPNSAVPSILQDPPYHLSPMSSALFFRSNDGATGWELWITDGTDSGTHLVADFTPGPVGTDSIDQLFDAAGTTFFTATAANGTELYKTDGTSAGTQMVKDIWPGTGSSFPSDFAEFGGHLYFNVRLPVLHSALWRSDGTNAGTAVVYPFPSEYDLNPREMTPLGDQLLFSGKVSLSGQNGALFATCGETNCTQRIAGSSPNGERVIRSQNYYAVGGLAFFIAGIENSAAYPTLWSTDGTVQGTWRLTIDVAPVSGFAYISSFRSAMNNLFFETSKLNSHWLWKSDGSQAGTVALLDVQPDLSHSSPTALCDVNGTLYFSADNGLSGYELWTTDGSPGGATMVKDIWPGLFGSRIEWQAALGSLSVFAADDGVAGLELWRSDGTPGGTYRLSDIVVGPRGSRPRNPCVHDGELFLIADDGAYGLWRTDGSVAGTAPVFDAGLPHSTAEFGRVTELCAVNGSLIFITSQDQLWMSSGESNNATLLLTNGATSDGLGVEGLVQGTGVAYFLAGSDVTGQELWKTDGKAGGTALVKDVRPGPQSSQVDWLTPVGNLLYFTAESGDGVGRELWRSDGTPEGTQLVLDIRPGAIGSSPSNLAAVDNIVYFAANDGVHGVELWRSDGTAPGTFMVRDLRPGPDSSMPGNITKIPWLHVAIFTAYDDAHGIELWVTDGTEMATNRISDIAVGPKSSNPRQLTLSGDLLYFQANDHLTGRELWALDYRDLDGDGIANFSDNCVLIPNIDQADADLDARGDACDACPSRHPGDIDGDLVIGPADLEPFVRVLLDASSATADELCAADANADGVVDARDITAFIAVRRSGGRD